MTYVTLTQIECAECGMTFGVTSDFDDRRRKDHKSFYCPNGHSNYFSARSKEDELRDALTRETAAHDQTRASREAWRKTAGLQEHRARAYKGIVKRDRRRTHAGVCLHCNRSFQNVRRHMQTKHGGRK